MISQKKFLNTIANYLAIELCNWGSSELSKLWHNNILVSRTFCALRLELTI